MLFLSDSVISFFDEVEDIFRVSFEDFNGAAAEELVGRVAVQVQLLLPHRENRNDRIFTQFINHLFDTRVG